MQTISVAILKSDNLIYSGTEIIIAKSVDMQLECVLSILCNYSV